MIQLDRILQPTDFSNPSRQAATYACELARQFDAQIHVLHVIELPIMAMPPSGAPLPETFLIDLERDAEKHVQSWLAAEGEGLSLTRGTQRGVPFVEIVRYARDQDIDLIVLGTHGRSGLTHALIGSVAEKVVRKAPCPVLTVRAEGHQFAMP